ncbi:MAG: sigma-70 family RNA polymerase sigma factor [Pirellulaceae bacterium]
MSLTPESAAEVEELHTEQSAVLERIAWAILRDWPLASDAVQEAFILLTQKWSEIPAENRRGWLVRTVQLTSQNLRRKQSRANRLPEELYSADRHHAASQPDSRHNEQAEQLRSAIAQLPSAQRQVVLLRLEQERSFAEIADELGVPLGTVLSRMRLALEKLRKQLDQ